MVSGSAIDPLVLAMALDRLAVYSSLALIFGVGAFTTLLAPEPVAREIIKRLGLSFGAAVAVFMLGTFLWLPLEAGQICGNWDDAFRPVTLRTLLSATASGNLWLERTAVCLLLVAARLAVPGRPGRHMVFWLSAASLVSLALAGHAAMDEGLPGDLHKANDAVHILAAAGWIGCLVALVPCLAMLSDSNLRRQACAALIRFSAAGHVAVALVLLTGVANTYLVVGHWPFDLRSRYQLLSLGKVVLAITMVALARVNRYALVPAIRVRGTAAVTDLRRLTIAELGLGSARARLFVRPP
jgi:putative copper resistance protein D